MPRVKHYMLVRSNTYEDLELQVNNAIAAGFVPQGGVSVSTDELEMYLVQALVHYDNPESKDG